MLADETMTRADETTTRAATTKSASIILQLQEQLDLLASPIDADASGKPALGPGQQAEAAEIYGQLQDVLDFLFRLPHLVAASGLSGDEVTTIRLLLNMVGASAKKRASEMAYLSKNSTFHTCSAEEQHMSLDSC